MKALLASLGTYFATTPTYGAGAVADILPWLRSALVIIGLASFTYALFSKEFSKSWIFGTAALLIYFLTGIFVGGASVVTLLLCLVGGILMLVEAIVPGFGVAGISGIVLFFFPWLLPWTTEFKPYLLLFSPPSSFWLWLAVCGKRAKACPWYKSSWETARPLQESLWP